MPSKRVTLYHGSDVAITHPTIALNTGFADLGQGFYLTPDRNAARRRAASRARRTGAAAGVVSIFQLDEGAIPWLAMGDAAPAQAAPFGLYFQGDEAGIAAWIDYITACRKGATRVDPAGDPAVVRAWIATEEVEMAAAGFVAAADVAPYLDPHDLTVQYCLRSQETADALLRHVDTEVVELSHRS